MIGCLPGYPLYTLLNLDSIRGPKDFSTLTQVQTILLISHGCKFRSSISKLLIFIEIRKGIELFTFTV